MSEPQGVVTFATEETYLHATDREREDAAQTFLSVEVSRELYGIPTEAVREIIRVGEITEVPRTPPFLLGVISVRGAIIPVLDLRRRLGFPPATTIARTARIVIVATGAQRFGLSVDDVQGLERFRAADIEPAPNVFGGGRGGAERYIQAIGRAIDRPDRIVIFLELAVLVDLAADLAAHRVQARRRPDDEVRG